MPATPRTRMCSARTARFAIFGGVELSRRRSPVDTYLAMLDTIGAGRGVLVQPAPYRTDTHRISPMHWCAAEGRIRGVAVLDCRTRTTRLLGRARKAQRRARHRS